MSHDNKLIAEVMLNLSYYLTSRYPAEVALLAIKALLEHY